MVLDSYNYHFLTDSSTSIISQKQIKVRQQSTFHRILKIQDSRNEQSKPFLYLSSKPSACLLYRIKVQPPEEMAQSPSKPFSIPCPLAKLFTNIQKTHFFLLLSLKPTITVFIGCAEIGYWGIQEKNSGKNVQCGD